MTTKKEVKKPVRKIKPKEQPLEQVIENSVVKQEPYTPVFESIKFRKFKRIDLNWLSLGIRFNKLFKFMRVKQKVVEVNPVEDIQNLRIEYNKKSFKEFLQNLKPDFCKQWAKFCVVWNYYINNDKSRDINVRLQEIEDYAERNKKCS